MLIHKIYQKNLCAKSGYLESFRLLITQIRVIFCIFQWALIVCAHMIYTIYFEIKFGLGLVFGLMFQSKRITKIIIGNWFFCVHLQHSRLGQRRPSSRQATFHNNKVVVILFQFQPLFHITSYNAIKPPRNIPKSLIPQRQRGCDLI